ncbi:MAG TPA: hypothetical protein VFQ61_33730, partial [Polyangiaceae bacterium]|nr:hypothetical protein [Polyangiaceae bacterium]
QTSPRTLTLDVGVTCESELVPRTPTRALALLDPLATSPLRFGVRTAAPAPGEMLSFDLSARDEDSDGREDFRLNVSLAVGSTTPLASAPLVFLDRAAGVSREAREPARAINEALKAESVRAQRKKTAEAVLARVDATRRLLATLCAEGATPRVFDWNGDKFTCGSLQDIVDRLGTLEVTAHSALSDWESALGALARDGWYFGKMRATARSALIKELQKHLTRVPVTRVSLSTVPKATTPPSLSPLSFDSGGALWLETDGGLVRIAPSDTREEPVAPDPSVSGWPVEPVGPRDERWISVSYSCDRSEVSLLLAGASDPTPAISGLLAPRPGVCAGGRFDEAFAPAFIAAHDAREVFVGGQRFGDKKLGAPGPRGSARSPSGARVAIPSSLGLWIQAEKSELWSVDNWDTPAARNCVVDDNARRAACIRGTRAELYLRNDSTQP